jgi:hypothetical protein
MFPDTNQTGSVLCLKFSKALSIRPVVLSGRAHRHSGGNFSGMDAIDTGRKLLPTLVERDFVEKNHEL